MVAQCHWIDPIANVLITAYLYVPEHYAPCRELMVLTLTSPVELPRQSLTYLTITSYATRRRLSIVPRRTSRKRLVRVAPKAPKGASRARDPYYYPDTHSVSLVELRGDFCQPNQVRHRRRRTRPAHAVTIGISGGWWYHRGRAPPLDLD